MTDWDRLTSVQPYPPPQDLPPGYDRHRSEDESLREALRSVVGTEPWARLTWTDLIEGLLSLGRTDVPLARLAEGHIDAVRILDQAGCVPRSGALYGVWASRSRRTGVSASPTIDGWRLDGTLRFASGAGVLDRALVPVWIDDEHHRLLDLDVRGLPVDSSGWVTSAMEVSRSHTVAIEAVVAPADAAVGPDDFYLNRPGFFPGGVGVAACWAGGAARIVDLLLTRPATSWSDPALARLGELRSQLVGAAAVVRTAAARLDRCWPERDTRPEIGWQLTATEARAAVAAAVAVVLEQSRRIGGAAGLAHDEDFSRAHHDLDLYVLQQNVDGDRAFLGRQYL